MTVGLMTNSLAVISDAFNSFTDIVASVAISWSVKISSKKADADHPFGHYRAEPIAAFVVAILMAIVAFEVLKEGVMRFFYQVEVDFSLCAIWVLLMAIFVKMGMFLYLKKAAQNHKSCALEATAIDSRNDVLASFVALLGVMGTYYNVTSLDSLAAILIAIWIGYAGYQIGVENIDYLMGRAPSSEILNECKKLALSEQGVKNVHDILAHYVGTFIHLEMHVEVDKNLSTKESHDIGKRVQKAVLGHEKISQIFVHVDPV